MPKCVDCDKQANFNLAGEKKAIYCKIHKSPEMVNVKSKKCQQPGCDSQPVFNVIGSKVGLYCASHKTPEMVNVKDKKCQHPGCDSQPVFNVIGSKIGLYCASHKTPEMVDVKNKKCQHPGCDSIPNFNVIVSKVGLYCASHKSLEMVDVKSKKCQHPGCDKVNPVFNVTGSKIGLYCASHKSLEMVDVMNTKCQHPGCDTRVRYGIPGKSPTHCAKHRETGMIQRPNSKCISCKAPAIYGINLKPRHCETHKVDEDINLTERECVSCGLLYVLDKDNRCENCNPEAFARAALAKQNALMSYLDVHDHPGTTVDDRIIDGGVCGKERPDRIIDLGDKILVIECDENQHKERACSCEQARMVNIAQSFGGVPVYFIRWNPDNYKTEKKTQVPLNQRYALLTELLTAIKSCKHVVPHGLVSVFYMFFDGWQGRPSMSESNWTTLLEFAHD